MQKIILSLLLLLAGTRQDALATDTLSESTTDLVTGILAEDLAGETEITRAINNTDIKTLAKLLQAGANPNQPNSIGQLPLTLASRKPNGFEFVKLLLENKANPNITEVNSGSTPLMRAINALKNTIVEADRDGIYKNIEKLILSGARVRIKSEKTGLTASDIIPTIGHDRIFDKLKALIESVSLATIVAAVELETEKARQNTTMLHNAELATKHKAKTSKLGRFLEKVRAKSV